MSKNKSINKTNAMRALDQLNIAYTYAEYDTKDQQIDGVSVAQKVGKPVETVFKTLVTQGHSKNYYVFVIPVAKELDLIMEDAIVMPIFQRKNLNIFSKNLKIDTVYKSSSPFYTYKDEIHLIEMN